MATYIFKLFIAGNTPRSERAVENLKRICESRLKNSFRLMVTDVLEQPELAKEYKILAAPTVVKESPQPARRIVGDLMDTEKVMLSLDLTINE